MKQSQRKWLSGLNPVWVAVGDMNKATPSGILSYFTRHGTAANLLLVILVVLGALTVPRMQTQFFPDVVVDSVSVSVGWDGAGPEDIDSAIVQILEPALLAVEGVIESSARSREGNASIFLEFEPGWNMDRAESEVQSAVDQISGLPDSADDPAVRRGAWRDPVTDVVIAGPVGVDQLARFADEFLSRLFTLGVTRVTIRGVSAPETVIELTEESLIKNDVSLADIAAAIATEAETDPSGEVAGGVARVRTGTARRSAEDIQGVEIRSFADGSKLLVSDVALVRTEPIDRARAYFVGSSPAISINVQRSQDGDAIEIQQVVQELADTMEPTLPKGVSIDLVSTRAEAITSRINILLENGAMGLGLVLILLLFFLNTRTAFWVALGIPVAMLSAVLFMYLAGLSLNMISVFALIICLGIVVDDAIVVGEHSDFRVRNLGETPVVAAENAARRMWLPVFSATLTTTIAFFGLTAISGRFGSLIADIPFTVIVVLIASLIECFLILPNHMKHSLQTSDEHKWYDFPSRIFNVGFVWFRDTVFRPFIQGVIYLRYPVVAGAFYILATQIVLFIDESVTWRFFNAPEQGQINGNFSMVNGATRADSMEMLTQLQTAVETTADEFTAEHGTSPVHFVIGQIGGGAGRGLAGAGTKDADLIGAISIELIDADLRPYSSFEFLAALQENVTRHPLLETFNFRSRRGGPGGDSLDVQMIGLDADTLKAAAEALKDAVSVYPEVSAVEDTLAFDKEEIALSLTAQGRALGFDTDTLSTVIRNRLSGIVAASFPIGTRSSEIRVQLAEHELTADFLDRTQIRTPEGAYVPLADIVTTSRSLGFSTVERENGLRVISVTGDISEDDAERATEISNALQETILPEIESQFGVETQMAGLAQQENQFLQDAMTGLILCLTGIFLALAWVFSSWTRPIVVMAIIPFGLIGTIWGHYIWDVPLSMFSVVGLIGMTGIIINDSIVLVSTIDEYAEKRGIIQAIIDGTTDRFRPVLLTTLTTVLGLAPLLYETSRDAQFLKPTVITLCYGLAFGMILVLLIVPSLIAMQTDAGKLIASSKRALRSSSKAPLVWGFYIGTILTIATAFAATVGSFVTVGSIWLIDFIPIGDDLSHSAPIALICFAIATAFICIASFAISQIILPRYLQGKLSS